MKKTIFTVALAALMLAGCSQEESLPTGEAVQMTFTANLSTGIQSRADGEAIVSVDKLICAVCKQTGEEETASLSDVLIRDTVDIDVTTGKATFTPTLLKSEKYGIVFWAYKEGQEYYDTKDLSKIAFTPNAAGNQDPNAEGMIAYTSTIKDVSTDSSGDALQVTLKRPLAQINVATTQSDWGIVNQLGETPATSTITLTGCSNVYNALNGAYSGEVNFTYTIALAEDTQLSGTDNILLGTGYTFPEGNVKCIVSIKNNEGTPDEIYKTEIPNLPTTANYRTNIVPSTTTDGEGNKTGGLMTGSVSYEVTISEGYTETVTKTPEQLEAEANRNNQGNNE